MDDDEINQRIAEACGLDISQYGRDVYVCSEGCGVVDANHGFTHHVLLARQKLPRYCSDLNAMHEAEKTLSEEQQDAFAHDLSQIIEQRFNCGPVEPDGPDIMVHREFDLLHATARQRAEAFLKTIGQ